ncbi:MAG: formylglycine-generating enzyme family protein [Bacteroidota bacterium]
MKNQLFCLYLLFFSITATKAQDYPEMISVEGGTFTMGDTEMEGESKEQPAHDVTLKSFKIAKTETTVAKWKVYSSATGRKMPESCWIDTHPVVNVSYEDVIGYCDWLSEVKDANYRLPTEAEWEFAARGGILSKGTKYSGSRSLDMVGVYEANSKMQIAAVSSKKPNELGIYDMSGNVWEWCKDWYGNYSSTAQSNPKGPSTGSYRVFRGGSWNLAASYCRVSSRNCFTSDHRSLNCGFRVLLSQ